jgi:hypothetical protein
MMQVLLSLLDVVRPYLSFVVPAVFFGFFVVAGIAIFWGRNRYVNRTYLVWFFTIFLVVNVVLSVVPIPFVSWHKFSDPREQEQTRYEIRVADGHGNEIQFDEKSTWKAMGIRMSGLRTKMRSEFDARQKREVSRYLLRKANERREKLQRQSWNRWGRWALLVRFPPHGAGGTWTAEKVAGFDEFASVRMYRLHIVTSEDGREIVSSEEELVFSYHVNGTVVDRTGEPATEPTNATVGSPVRPRVGGVTA